MNDLYETDFYAWTQEQAAILRSLRVTDNRVDIAHVAEEIEDLGKSEFQAVVSYCRNIVAHLLKIEFSGLSDPQRHWRREVRTARLDVRQRLSPSIEARLPRELDKIYRLARLQLRDFDEDFPGLLSSLPEQCPYTIEEIVGAAPEDDWFPEPRTKRPYRRRSRAS